jgi:hypothetical protein
MGMLAENFQNGRARAGDFSRLSAQASGQSGQFLPQVRMFVRAVFHQDAKITPAVSKSKLSFNGGGNGSKKIRPAARAAGGMKSTLNYFINSIWRARLMAVVSRR